MNPTIPPDAPPSGHIQLRNGNSATPTQLIPKKDPSPLHIKALHLNNCPMPHLIILLVPTFNNVACLTSSLIMWPDGRFWDIEKWFFIYPIYVCKLRSFLKHLNFAPLFLRGDHNLFTSFNELLTSTTSTSVLHADMARHLELSPESEGDRSKEVTIFNSITFKFQNRLDNWESAQCQNGAQLRTAVKWRMA